MNNLLAAVVLFVAGHFALSSVTLRTPLIAKLGDGPFRGLYAAFSLATLVWAGFAYAVAPDVRLWPAAAGLKLIPLLVMPIAVFLLIAGYTTKSPTRVGAKLSPGEVTTVSGVLRITRHPFLWAAALWALSHIIARGDLAVVILMGGIVVLAFGGMLHIDQRREAEFGAAWGPIALSTSVIPFAALASGRTTMDWEGIGWWRVALGLALYAAFLVAHPWIFGVSALP
ncbi:MAG: hypothetical protein EXQ88_05820 [Alphaproteobacteria bacterium]|nr:hypothetical protein [Alphaproteobacteria bacterium]